ncbi:Foldase protein PrsA precursor at Foldase clustered with pyrimidine conversion [Pediococcus damnosus]|uniref:peptidylprolyl isomerase PrsA n=1 Tax=Pediococcus damnosus TaxID=51663 RepID=UPI00078CBC53|nr:peptidylprolyl isomerase PrsA [Pediococcus damnosus]AMV70035.1 Foldase protein PrsA precursor at Foldase clustered with pyrimidine conversion [Pediococcus damnosus]
MKKWLIALASVFMAVSLASCGDKTVATTKGGKITEDTYYSSLKSTSSGEQVLQQMILNKVLEKDYGSKVSTKKVTKQYNAYKTQYGSQFKSVLEQNGMTNSSFKEEIRSNLLLEQAVKDKSTVTNADLKKQWKTYQPKVTVAQILVTKKSTADTVIKKLNDGESFTSLAKKYSTDSSTKNKGGKLAAFDDTNTSLDSSFTKAAFKLDEGKYTTTPVKTTYGYQVIKMINKPAKGKMSDHTEALKKRVWAADMSSSSKLKAVVSKVLKDGNVSIKDNDLKDVLSDYLSSSSTSK